MQISNPVNNILGMKIYPIFQPEEANGFPKIAMPTGFYTKADITGIANAVQLIRKIVFDPPFYSNADKVDPDKLNRI